MEALCLRFFQLGIGLGRCETNRRLIDNGVLNDELLMEEQRKDLELEIELARFEILKARILVGLAEFDFIDAGLRRTEKAELDAFYVFDFKIGEAFDHAFDEGTMPIPVDDVDKQQGKDGEKDRCEDDP